MKERCLAAAVGADETDALRWVQLQVHVTQDRATRLVGEPHLTEAEQRVAHSCWPHASAANTASAAAANARSARVNLK